MPYFSKFPLMAYSIKGTDYKLVPDILRRVKLRANIRNGMFMFDNYDVKEGETPESVAHKWFGDVNSHLVEVNSDASGASAVTNREYEHREQDKLRQIRLLNPRYLSTFVQEFDNLIQD